MKKTYLIIILLVAITLVLFLLVSKKIEVQSSFPSPNSSDIDTHQSISLVFNKSISLQNIKADISPKIQYQPYLSENNHTLTLKPDLPLFFSTTYLVSIYYQDKLIYQIPFKTRAISQQEIVDLGGDQALSDYEFSKAQGEVLKEKPYLYLLPIETDNFRAVYDYQQQKIRIRLKIEITNEAEKNQYTQEALTELENKKIDAKSIGYYVLENNETQP